MTIDHFSGSEDGHQMAALLEAAEPIATRRNVPAKFVAALFGRAATEDLTTYSADEIALFAEAAWAHLGERTGGRPNIRMTAYGETPEHNARASVIEIINDDMPFLLDSIMGEMADCGLEVRLVVHPVLTITRDTSGRVTGFFDEKPLNGSKFTSEKSAVSQSANNKPSERCSLIHIHVDPIVSATQQSDLSTALERTLRDVRVCVDDWRPMKERVTEAMTSLKTSPPPLAKPEIDEAVAFLEWLLANNFTFLGVRNYILTNDDQTLESMGETGLGILRTQSTRVVQKSNQLVQITPQIRATFSEPWLLIVTKSAVRSRVHRRVHMDYVGVKQFDQHGRLVGEFRIVGLFTSTVYTRPPRTIPYLRRKFDTVLTRAGFDPDGHSGKALVNVLDTYPRDELFQIDDETLFQFALAILQLDERPRVRVLPRHDRFERYVSVLVFVPRDRYDSDSRKAIGHMLARSFNGNMSAFFPFFPEGPLVRVHFIIGRRDGELARPERSALDAMVADIVRTWHDTQTSSLAREFEPGKARSLSERYHEAFSDGYREVYSPSVAVADVRVIENLSPDKPMSADFHLRTGDGRNWPQGLEPPTSDCAV